jgi:sugar phosphate isomerase/epimerase
MTFDSTVVGCSTISFRALPLPVALDVIAEIGFAEIDLGALPGVCDHVPRDLTGDAVASLAAQVAASGLAVRSVNADIGDLNAELDANGRLAREGHLGHLLELTARIGATALVLPCGASAGEPVRSLDQDLDRVAAELARAAERAASFGVELWTESLHVFRLCNDTERAAALHRRLDPAVGVVLDFSHVTASGGDVADFARATERIRHVHIRDARPGDIHLSVGRGVADFAGGLAALSENGYTGHVSLELETRDVRDPDRPAAARAAAEYISALL